MENEKRGRGGVVKGIAPRQTAMRVSTIDKPLLETYRALLDNPCTRDAAIDCLNMVQELSSKL
jgi:hypothetical protein